MSDGPYEEVQRNSRWTLERVPEKIATIPDLGGCGYIPSGGDGSGDGAPLYVKGCDADGNPVLFLVNAVNVTPA